MNERYLIPENQLDKAYFRQIHYTTNFEPNNRAWDYAWNRNLQEMAQLKMGGTNPNPNNKNNISGEIENISKKEVVALGAGAILLWMYIVNNA